MAAPAAEAETLTGRAAVVDGDSIVIGGERIHILDIDAPETGQLCFRRTATIDEGAWHCGREAAAALSTLIGDRRVTCDTMDKGINHGWLARCTVGGEDLAGWLAVNGWAVPSHDCKCEVVRSAADQAKASQRGIWSSAFTMPWEWRKEH
ncbi:MAG: thermonuclease family protein [Dongiaceae bacterium]